eukprot:snap_masked-scaffold_23-processed-gene-4.9-mRNA-1 protein AED:1.00 eAED:1.00 QI:0/0/0/0/1/1/3/0/78
MQLFIIQVSELEILFYLFMILLDKNSLYFYEKKAIYLVVFNLTKLKEKDLFRLKFWCENILRNTPKAPILFFEEKQEA